MKKTDCFAYKDGKCTVLVKTDCETCHFYKVSGTECDTCYKNGTDFCNHCRGDKQCCG